MYLPTLFNSSVYFHFISPCGEVGLFTRAGSGEGVCILGQRRSREREVDFGRKEAVVRHALCTIGGAGIRCWKKQAASCARGGTITSERDAKVWVRKCVQSDELLFKDSRLDINAVAIMGAVRFLDGWYLWVLSRFAPCGELAGHTVHEVVETKLIALSTCSVSPSPMSSDEKRYYAIFMSHARSLRSNSFFSFSYDLTNSVQYNNDVCAGNSSGEYNDQMTWNAHHLRGILAGVPIEPSTAARGILTRWLLPVIHGFFEQCTFLIPDGGRFTYPSSQGDPATTQVRGFYAVAFSRPATWRTSRDGTNHSRLAIGISHRLHLVCYPDAGLYSRRLAAS